MVQASLRDAVPSEGGLNPAFEPPGYFQSSLRTLRNQRGFFHEKTLGTDRQSDDVHRAAARAGEAALGAARTGGDGGIRSGDLYR